MDWKASFMALREIFPQVDERIVKAVALEHRNDVDSAVEFILNEVVPNQNDQIANVELDSERGTVDDSITNHDCDLGSERLVPTSPRLLDCSSVSDDDASEGSDDEIILTDRRSDYESIVADLNRTKTNAEYASSSSSVNSLTDQETNNSIKSSFFLAFSDLSKQCCDENTIYSSSSFCSQPQTRIETQGFSSHLYDMVGVTKGDRLCCSEKSLIQFEDGNAIEVFNFNKYSSDAKSAEVNLLAVSSAGSGMVDSETLVGQCLCTDTTNVSSYEEENQCTEEAVVRANESQLNFSVIEEPTKSMNASESFYKESTDSLPLIQTTEDFVGLSDFKNDNAPNVELDTGCSFISVEDGSLSCSEASSSSRIVNIDTLEGFVEDGSLSCSRTSSSSQIVSVDTLEGFVSEAKKDKEMLMEAMELIRSLRAEADREEIAAQRAKEEAAKGGMDILSKVEELRKMLSRAKETNDMHAGEVYGERAILATEARELRSRLAQLSADKDKAFCMIGEMQENLQTRVCAARKQREAAEEEKMRKEENARKVLSMEEALMAKVARDSRELELEAENNTKLRESLIDCGHMVDALQGEVSVLSEDVKLLKEQMDGGITKFANGVLNINLASPPRCQNMDGHWTSPKDNIFGSFSSRTHGRNDDIGMSRFSTRSGSRDSQDAQSLHSSLYQSIDNVATLIPAASSARLAEFVPYTGFPSTHNNDEEMGYHRNGVGRFMAETDTDCQGVSPQSSNYSVEAEKQQYVKTGSDDGWQMLDVFGEEFRKSVSGSPTSPSLVKTKQS